MSDAVRNYTTLGRGSYSASSSGRGWIRRLLVVVLLCGFIWLYWTTRDTYPIERLVPREQTFHLQAEHLLASRMKAADSPLWNLGLIPEEYKSIPGWLGNDFGLPDWVLNNLVSDVCHVSGTDFSAFSDLLVVTRMSRIGCLIERYHRFVDGIEDEYAGGLQLRRMVDTDMYYAVRGRTLVFSPSREALIGCLSQRDEDAIESLENVVAASGGDVQGKVVLPEDNSFGQYFERADFALTFAPSSITFACRGEVRPDWRGPLERLTRSSSGNGAKVPADGSVVVAGDFGAPLPEVWRVVDEISNGALGAFVGESPLLQRIPADNASWIQFADDFAGSLGTSFYLRWAGFDLDGVVPLPEMELAFAPDRGALRAVLEAIPGIQNGGAPEDGVPYRDPETGVVHCPIGWGGIVEPVIAPTPDGVRATLHPSHLAPIATAGGAVERPVDAGQFYVRVRPAEALELLRDGGALYAEAGLIQGHTPESFQEAMTAALEGIQQVFEARLSARYEEGALFLELVIDLDGVAATE